MTFDDVCRIAAELPRVARGTSYGTPALHAGKKFMARLKEDGVTMVLKIGFDVRDILIEAKPKTFFITDHYRDHPSVLIRLEKIGEREMRGLLRQAWEFATARRRGAPR